MVAFETDDARGWRDYTIGDEVYFTLDPEEAALIGTVVAIGKNDDCEELSYGICIVDGARRLPSAVVVNVPRRRILGLTEQDITPWHVLLSQKLRRSTRRPGGFY